MSRNVPCRPGSAAAERGNISYQAPKRARSRSTMTPQGPVVGVAAGAVGVAVP